MRGRGTALLLALMILFGFGVYRVLAYVKGAPARAAAPHHTKSGIALPGRLYLAQEGGLYVLQGGTFTQLQPPAGQWSQPALVPDGSGLIAVSRGGQYSDLYLLSPAGRVLRQLTQNQSRILANNHWAYYPQVSPDSRTVYFSKDSPKFGYQVDFSIRSFPLAGPSASVAWTAPNPYTGGDVEAHPLPSGGLLYVKHSIQAGSVFSQLWLQKTRYDAGTALTDPAADCREPALSAAEDRVLMICTEGKQQSHLVTATFDGAKLGPPQELVTTQLAAAPVWAPDGSGVAFLAPDPSTSRFQLWWLPIAQVDGPAPPKPVEVTSDLDLDPLSQPAWAE